MYKRFYLSLFLLCLSLFSFLVLYQNGKKALKDFDEGIYAEVAREAYANPSISKHFLDFEWKGNIGLDRTKYWFEKPPLMIWLIEGLYKMN